MQHEKYQLTRWIVILPLIGIFLTVCLLVYRYIDHEIVAYHKESNTIKSKFIKNSKQEAHRRIENLVHFIETNTATLEQEAKLQAKYMVNFATSMIDSIYQEHKDLPKEKILKLIHDKLFSIRFYENKSGYFFIYDLNGVNIMHPLLPNIEGKNLIHLKTPDGTLVIQESIDLVKRQDEGMYEWYWQKIKGEAPKKKYGYLQQYAPLNLFIGTGRYEEDMIEAIKPNLQKLLAQLHYDTKGNLFAYDYNGETIAHQNKKLIGTNQWDVQVKDGYLIRQIITGAQIIPEGFFMSHSEATDFGKDPELHYTSSYIQALPRLQWIIGTRTYGDELLYAIAQQKNELEEKFKTTISNVSITTFFVLIFMFIGMTMISNKLKSLLNDYQEKLLEKHNKTLEQQDQLIYQVNHDPLTDLPNRLLLADRLEQMIARASREEHLIGILFLDIDKFKSINDSFGHNIGDILLQKVAKYLRSSVRTSDTVARFSGDEFVILIDDCKDTHDILHVITKIIDNFHRPLRLDNTSHYIRFSMGISVFPTDGTECGTLLKHADMAMFKAKEAGRDQYKFFTQAMNNEVLFQIQLEQELKEAIHNQEFILHYQPLINAQTNQLVGLEALVRWNHPMRGLIYPKDFIDIAEESHLIIDIGNIVLKEAMQQATIWRKQGYDPGRISVNFAGKQLESKHLFDTILEYLGETRCKPEWIEIEVVERFVMKDPERSIKLLEKLKAMHMTIAIDDFGTGYSSLAYLKQLPITKLKIDRTFVSNILNSHEDKAIAQTIIALASGLNLTVLAEGVETQEEKEYLLMLGCKLMQGYLFSKPKSPQEIEPLLIAKKEKRALF